MDDLTLITDEKEYMSETAKPEMPQTEEAWKKVEEERIAWEKAEKIAEEHPETLSGSNPKSLVKLVMVQSPETDEYKIKWIEDDVFSEAKSYYTNDFDDAVATQIAMAADAKRAGFDVIRTNPEDLRPESSNPDEPIIPDEVDIGEVSLKLGETFYYAAWGIRYRFKGGGWSMAEMVFRKKSDAIDWASEHLKYDGIETEVVPAKRCLELTKEGHTKAWTEELT